MPIYRERFTVMPLTGMVKDINMISCDRGYVKDEYLGEVSCVRVNYSVEPYEILTNIIKRNEGESGPNHRGLNIANSAWKTNSLVKQKYKMKQNRGLMESTYYANTERILKVREAYRNWIIKQFKYILNLNVERLIENMMSNLSSHPDSSIISGLKAKNMPMVVTSYLVRCLRLFVAQMLNILSDVDTFRINENIIWDFLKVGFETMRGKTKDFNYKDGNAEENFFESRDVVNLGPCSHWMWLMDHEKVRQEEAQIISVVAKICGLKVMSPLVNNQAMWRYLRTHWAQLKGFDGSNWQMWVGYFLAGPLSCIYRGWIMLASGSITTSLEGILCMILCVSIAFPTVKTICSFGDDVMVDDPELTGVKGFIEEGPEYVFLGYDLKRECATSIKICQDKAERQFGAKYDEIKTGRRREGLLWRTSKPDHQTRVSLCIAYGFIDRINPLVFNEGEIDYWKPGRIGAKIRQSAPDVWNDCVEEYTRKNYDTWWNIAPTVHLKHY
jgi:hypothetical protein